MDELQHKNHEDLSVPHKPCHNTYYFDAFNNKNFSPNYFWLRGNLRPKVPLEQKSRFSSAAGSIQDCIVPTFALVVLPKLLIFLQNG